MESPKSKNKDGDTIENLKSLDISNRQRNNLSPPKINLLKSDETVPIEVFSGEIEASGNALATKEKKVEPEGSITQQTTGKKDFPNIVVVSSDHHDKVGDKSEVSKKEDL